jgi:hypothetical protein
MVVGGGSADGLTCPLADHWQAEVPLRLVAGYREFI